MAKPRVKITKEELEKAYYEENRSAVQVAVLFNCTSTTIKNYLRKYDLRVKDSSEVMKGRVLSEEHKKKIVKTLRNGKGADNPNWKGGRSWRGRDRDNAYPIILIDGKYVPEHRYVMEQHLGRKLKREEEVHHKNGNKYNNDISNLIIMTKSEHATFHNHDPVFRARKSATMKATLQRKLDEAIRLQEYDGLDKKSLTNE